MDTLKSVLFENPLAIYVVLALAEVVLAWMWYTRRDRRLVRWLLVVPAAGLVVALTAWLVVTDREKIERNLKDMAAAVVAGDFDKLGSHLDASCYAPVGASSIGQQELLDRGREVVRLHHVRQITLESIDTAIAGPNASTLLNTRIYLSNFITDSIAITWKMQWGKRDGQWRLTAVQIDKPAMLADFRSP
jgi:hypothetical protein